MPFSIGQIHALALGDGTYISKDLFCDSFNREVVWVVQYLSPCVSWKLPALSRREIPPRQFFCFVRGD